MRFTPLGILCACVAVLCTGALAQQDPRTTLLDSPVKSDREIYRAGEQIVCSLPLPGTAAMFGVDTVDGSADNKTFLTNELFAPFRVWEYEDACQLVKTWSTAFTGATMTGIGLENSPSGTYWVVNPTAGLLEEFVLCTGEATSMICPLPAGGSLPGPLVFDDNRTDECDIQDIGTDTIICLDMSAGCAFICSFANADNTGGGAFGNGIGDAVDTSVCGGATLVPWSTRPERSTKAR